MAGDSEAYNYVRGTQCSTAARIVGKSVTDFSLGLCSCGVVCVCVCVCCQKTCRYNMLPFYTGYVQQRHAGVLRSVLVDAINDKCANFRRKCTCIFKLLWNWVTCTTHIYMCRSSFLHFGGISLYVHLPSDTLSFITIHLPSVTWVLRSFQFHNHSFTFDHTVDWVSINFTVLQICVWRGGLFTRW